jgi:hypothetical protein
MNKLAELVILLTLIWEVSESLYASDRGIVLSHDH